MTNIVALGSNTGNWKESLTFAKNWETISILPEEVTKIDGVVVTSDNNDNANLFFLSSEGKLYQTNPYQFQPKLKAIENIPPIKKICSGYYHFFAISDEEDQKVYGWGENTDYQLGLQISKTYSKLTVIESLKKIKIHEIYPSGNCSFFLNKETNDLYGCGSNESGELGINGSHYIHNIRKLHKQVTKVFTGKSDHSFIIKKDGELYGFGLNINGQLGNGTNRRTQKIPTKIQLEFQVEEISQIIIDSNYSLILTTDGRVYVTGQKRYTGFGSDLTKFQQYSQFKNNSKVIKNISSASQFISFLTEDNEIWVGGSFGTKYKNNSLRKLIDVDEKYSSFNTLKCLDNNVIFFLKLEQQISYLSQDLENLLENGYLSYSEIKNIKVHKLLIEIRIGKSFEKVKKYLEENYNQKEIENVLKWIYCDKIINSKRTKEILKHFGIENPKKTKSLKNDLKKLLNDEITSDFTLRVNNEEDEDEEDIEEEEFHVHKFILAARSGLFCDMFQNLDQNLKKVKDYSNKSIETIELLISFLYTDEIPITADHDQEFIKEEFKDIVEYYQLNPKIPILDIFDKFSKNSIN
ncbi:btk-binding protein-related [Anaeramoeba flamelloides]|uniref:Btk-binding protein-related n=1 Tax=Anaeramoeba flamelloides TaxID=1746091 RepID=A0AAV7ZNA2_9EUKA|nr:btk-binding protein-related [Anaeramoeba flamelloides]